MSKSWDPDFTPSFTPEEMLKKGVFEGKYINNIKGVPAKWKGLPKVVGPKDPPDPKLNYYGLKSRQPLSEWKSKGWIMTDKNGWFEWYIHYFLGRRLGEEDTKQIKRWKSFVARHQAQVSNKCKKGDNACNSKQRQGLLQWAWDSDTDWGERQREKNLKRILNITGTVLDSVGKESIPPSLLW